MCARIIQKTKTNKQNKQTLFSNKPIVMNRKNFESTLAPCVQRTQKSDVVIRRFDVLSYFFTKMKGIDAARDFLTPESATQRRSTFCRFLCRGESSSQFDRRPATPRSSDVVDCRRQQLHDSRRRPPLATRNSRIGGSMSAAQSWLTV